jgi:hypothetical protein
MAAVEEKWEAELEKLTAMDERARNVYAARQHIVGQILTLHCPRPNCKQAFLDFDGCFALKCHLSGCGFCAWCPKDCGGCARACKRVCFQTFRS